MRRDHRYVIVRLEGSELVLATIAVADTARMRMVGLLGRRRLERDDGLLLRPCRSVHTCFMRFAIDVLFVDDRGYIVTAFDDVRPFRFVAGARTSSVAIELAAGTRRLTRLAVGRQLRIEAP